MGVCWWHHQLSGHESEQTLRDSEGQGSLACCSPWCRKESDTADQLNHSSKWYSLCIFLMINNAVCLEKAFYFIWLLKDIFSVWRILSLAFFLSIFQKRCSTIFQLMLTTYLLSLSLFLCRPCISFFFPPWLFLRSFFKNHWFYAICCFFMFPMFGIIKILGTMRF